MVEVIAPGFQNVDAGAVSKRFKDSGYLDVHAKRLPRASAGSAFWVCSKGSDCACGSVAQDKPTPPELRRLRPEWVGELRALLEYLRARSSPDTLCVNAADVEGPWDRRPVIQKTTSSLDDFLKILVQGMPASGVSVEITRERGNSDGN